MTFQQLLRILRARSRTVFAITVLAVLAALAVSLVLPKKYTAGAAVVVDVKSPDPIAGTVLPGLISPSYIATQIAIVNSSRVAQRVVKRLHLDEDPRFRQQWREATGGVGDLTSWIGTELQRNLDVKPSRESSVIDIKFKGIDPAFVTEVANAFAQSYIDIDIELKVQPARQNAEWFEEQTRQARTRLETAQRAYSAYQKQTGVIAAGERLDLETARLEALSTQFSAAQSELSDTRGKARAASGGNLPEVIQNPLVVSLKTEIARLESRLQESNVNLGRNHPQTKRAESELESLRSRLDSETRKIISGLGTAHQVASQKEAELRAAIQEQKARILSLTKENDDISVLKRDVDSAQRAFDDVSQRAAQTRLESLSVLTNVAILNPASIPTVVSSPKIALNVVLALVMGMLLGTGIALTKELSNRRVRSPGDLVDALALPLLAAIPHAAPVPFARRRGWSLRHLLPSNRRLAVASTARSPSGV